MSLCTRCKSNNNGDIKFCNFCGARMRASIAMDCYGESVTYNYSMQAVPLMDEEPVNNKLSYRYFLKGRHAFSAGDLNRATLMFQCALDANPSDNKVRAFLKRAVDMKALSVDDRCSIKGRSQTQSPGLSALVSSDSETIDMAPLLRHSFPKRANGHEKGTLVRAEFGSPSEDTSVPLWETIPSSPAELLDNAPSGDKWNDFFASFAAIAGVIIFGLVLTM